MQTKPVRSLVVPALPPIDKYIAAKRVMLDCAVAPFRLEVVFCDVNIPTPQHYMLWDRGNPGSAFLIDVGDLKYHKGYQSASEMAKMSSPVEGGLTWNRLQELANENNRTGSLKQRRHSVAKMVREIPHVFTDRVRSQAETWAYGMDVVDSFFWRMDRREWNELFDNPQYADLRKLWDGFNVKEEEVLEFTLPLYFRKLFRSGRPVGEIMRRMSWWLDHSKQVQMRHDRAQRMNYKPRRFRVGHHHEAEGALININDYFEASAFGYQFLGNPNGVAIGVIRNPKGGVLIQTSFRHRWSLDKLYERLAADEPNRWYFEGRFSSGPMLMNQSWQFTGVTPTSKTDDELIQLVATLAEYQGHK